MVGAGVGERRPSPLWGVGTPFLRSGESGEGMAWEGGLDGGAVKEG